MGLTINSEELPSAQGFHFEDFLGLGFEDFEPDCLEVDIIEDIQFSARDCENFYKKLGIPKSQG